MFGTEPIIKSRWLLWPQNYAIARGSGNGDQSGPGLFQRIGRARMNREGFQMAARKSRSKLAEHSAGRDRRQPEAVDTDIRVLTTVEFKDVELHDRLDGGDQYLTPSNRQGLVRGLEIGVADRVEDDIGALSSREFA